MSEPKRLKPKMFRCQKCGERFEEWFTGSMICLGCHELFVMEQTGVGVVKFQPGVGLYMK